MYYCFTTPTIWLIFRLNLHRPESDITTLVYVLVSVQIETSNCPGGIKDLSK